MNVVLWILQVVLGLYFIGVGIMHFVVPPGLPQPMAWMYELPQTLHVVAGIAEIAGGLGLILPAALRIRTGLVPLAAAGLVLTMAGAALWHLGRGEMANIGLNVLNAALLAFVAYGRWRLRPLAIARSS